LGPDCFHGLELYCWDDGICDGEGGESGIWETDSDGAVLSDGAGGRNSLCCLAVDTNCCEVVHLFTFFFHCLTFCLCLCLLTTLIPAERVGEFNKDIP